MEVDQKIKQYFSSAISFDVAERLPTKRLLTFYKKYRSIELAGYTSEQIITDYFSRIRSILNTREHVSK